MNTTYVPVVGFALFGGLSIFLSFLVYEKNRLIRGYQSYLAAGEAIERYDNRIDCLSQVYKVKKRVAKKKKVKKANKK